MRDSLTLDQQRRYARHLILPPVGESGQAKLLASRVAVIGAGGLGSAALTYIAAAGIGDLTIIDADRVDPTNLQRQILHEEADVGRLKSESAHDRIEELNSACRVHAIAEHLTHQNAAALLANMDVVIDGCDNFATRFAVAGACQSLRTPLISGAAQGFQAQLTTYTPYLGNTHPCYRCFVPEVPDDARTCTETGVLGPLVGIIGSWQAAEAIKILAGVGSSLSGQLLRIDLLTNRVAFSTLLRDPACAFCNAA